MAIYLSLGSNLGDRYEYFKLARKLLKETGIQFLGQSSEKITKAWGVIEQPDFLNQVLRVDFTDKFKWQKAPYGLLAACQFVERKMGKIMYTDKNYVKWSPRIIDIDILAFDNIKMDDFFLTIPHHSMDQDYIKDMIQECQ